MNVAEIIENRPDLLNHAAWEWDYNTFIKEHGHCMVCLQWKPNASIFGGIKLNSAQNYKYTWVQKTWMTMCISCEVKCRIDDEEQCYLDKNSPFGPGPIMTSLRSPFFDY